MRTKLITLGVAATVAAGLAAVSLASGSGPSGASVTTMRVIHKGVGLTSIDADRDGKPSVGDYAIGQTLILDQSSGKPIGRGTIICTQVTASGAEQCQGASLFAGGLIASGGRFTAGKGFRQAILGGTGAYQGVSGSYEGTWLDSHFGRAKVTYTIRVS